MNINLSKDEIRTDFKARRSEHSKSPVKRQEDSSIIAKLLEMPEIQNAQIISVYDSYDSEVSTKELIAILTDIGKQIAIPKVISESPLNMIFVMKDDTMTQVQYSAIECAVIPGIAFDSQLNRIGFGKGFFDYALSKMNCPKIGLAYDFQIVQNVPVCPHDEKLTHIITPTKIYE